MTRRTHLHIIGLLLVLLAVQTGIATAAVTNQTDLTIFADASLTGVMEELIPIFEASHPGVKVTIISDGTTGLEEQIREGAMADLFLPESTGDLEVLRKEGLIDDTSITPYATSKLAIIVPTTNTAGITHLSDLGKAGVRLASGTAEMPVHQYTDQMLDKTRGEPMYGEAFVRGVKKNIALEETSMAGVTTRVASGQADAAISYEAEVSKDLSRRVKLIEIPDPFNVVVPYQAGVLTEAPRPDLAAEFIALLTSGEGKAVLQDYKFSTS